MGVYMDKKNYNIAKKIYIKILIVLFSVSSVIAIGGKIVKQILRGYGYVFHSWLDVTYLIAWVLMIGLILIIPFTYLNAWLGGIIIPFVLFVAFIWGTIGYNEEIRKGEYIVTETQQIGEKAIRYYENINIFFMKFHHEEYVR